MSQLGGLVNFESRILNKKRIIFRDDQISWLEAMDLARWLSIRKKTFVLIDSGRFNLAQLEWLAERKTIIVSYQEVGRSWSELLLLAKVSRRAGKPVIFGYKGTETGEKVGEVFLALNHLARGGVDIHVSGRSGNFNVEVLDQLAADCRRGQAFFVYYHYGPLEIWLNQLAMREAWIHILGHFFEASQANLLEEILKSYPRRGRMVIHLEDESQAAWLIDFIKEGRAYLIFHRPPWPSFFKKEYPFNFVLPFRAYHLEARAFF